MTLLAAVAYISYQVMGSLPHHRSLIKKLLGILSMERKKKRGGDGRKNIKKLFKLSQFPHQIPGLKRTDTTLAKIVQNKNNKRWVTSIYFFFAFKCVTMRVLWNYLLLGASTVYQELLAFQMHRLGGKAPSTLIMKCMNFISFIIDHQN